MPVGLDSARLDSSTLHGGCLVIADVDVPALCQPSEWRLAKSRVDIVDVAFPHTILTQSGRPTPKT